MKKIGEIQETDVYDIMDNFSLYLQDLTPTYPNFQLNLPSINIQCKKTIDDMKRIGSILKGYSKSKLESDQHVNQRRKRINSKQSQSGKSSANESRIKAKQLLKEIQDEKSRVSNQSCKFQQAQEISNRLRNYRSLGHLEKPFNHQQQLKFDNVDHISSRVSLQNIDKQLMNLQNLNQRIGSQQFLLTFTASKQNTGRINRPQQFQEVDKHSVTSKTQTKFKQCLRHHQSGINEIISRNNECLLMIKQIQNKVIKKKNKGKKLKQNLNTFGNIHLNS